MSPVEPAGCLDDSVVLALCDGAISADARGPLEDHLDGCARCRRLVAEIQRDHRTEARGHRTQTVAADRPAASVVTEMPARIGRYLVLSLLGRGGMGVVWRAYDPELHRQVAIKVVAIRGAAARDRLLGEAHALAQLADPRVVRVFDAGRHGDDVFVAMELVEGRTLRAWIGAEAPSARRRLEVLVQIGAGLAAAHRASLVHRDVKPDNVIVDADGAPHLIDFGLARRVEECAAAEGTPAYMAPEQRDRAAVTASADQFAFAVMAWEALFGVRPTAGTIAARTSRIARVLARALALDPTQRYASMDALLTALAPRRRRGFVLAVAAVGAVGALALAVGVALRPGAAGAPPPPACADGAARLDGAWDPAHKRAVAAGFAATRHPRAAEHFKQLERSLDGYAQAWVRTYHAACTATRVARTQPAVVLDRSEACLDRSRASLSALVDALTTPADAAVLERAVEAAAALPDVRTCGDLDALVRRHVDPVTPDVAGRVAELDQLASLTATGQYARGLALARTVVGREPSAPDRWAARARYWLGVLNGRSDDPTSAERELERAIGIAAAIGDDELIARGWIELIGMRGDGGRLDDAMALRVVADTALVRAGDPWQLRVKLLTNLGIVATDRGAFREAIGLHEQALALATEHAGGDSVDAATALSNLGNALDGARELPRAIEVHTRALATRRLAFGEHHPHVAASLSNLAVAYRSSGQPRRALTLLDEAHRIARDTAGPRSIGVALVLSNTGLALRDLGDRMAAAAALSQAHEIVLEKLGTAHPLARQAQEALDEVRATSRRGSARY